MVDVTAAPARPRPQAGKGWGRGLTHAPVTDVHQHLWPEGLLAALSARRSAPRLCRSGGGWELRADGEPVCAVDPRHHDPIRRAEQARHDGVERIIIAPSCPIGIESLPAREAEPLLESYHDGVAALGEPFQGWAAAPLEDPDAASLSARLDAGFVGLCLPAAAFSVPDELRRVAPLLELMQNRRAPLLIHPGPAPWARAPAVPTDAPGWWSALTTYVAQMQQAWFVVQQFVRPEFPGVRICFAMLAGLAPLQSDRLRSRGVDPPIGGADTFLETSSYGPELVAAVASVVGDRAIVFGSDRPVVHTAPAPASATIARDNAARLIGMEVWE